MKKKHKRALSAALQCVADMKVQLDEFSERARKLEDFEVLMGKHLVQQHDMQQELDSQASKVAGTAVMFEKLQKQNGIEELRQKLLIVESSMASMEVGMVKRLVGLEDSQKTAGQMIWNLDQAIAKHSERIAAVDAGISILDVKYSRLEKSK